jgi:FMN reductase
LKKGDMDFGDERLRVVGIGGTLREGSTSLGALRGALKAAREAGAETELLDLREMNLPMYEPGRPLDDFGPEVERLIEVLREADALILGAAAYHGTLAGVTKNALDFAQLLARDERPYLEDRVVGLISTAGGEQATAHTTDAMVHIVHALRGVVAPLMVTIPRAWQRSDDEGNITDERYGGRLDRLGRLVGEMAGRMNLESGRAEAVGVAV